MTAAGVGGPITGKGAHLFVVDDPIKGDEQARSASFRQKQWEWWQSVATTRLRPSEPALVRNDAGVVHAVGQSGDHRAAWRKRCYRWPPDPGDLVDCITRARQAVPPMRARSRPRS